MDDHRLAEKLHRGDRLALDRAMTAYTGYLSAVVWQVLGPAAPREDVEEVVSDAFLSLWQHRDRLNAAQGVKAYLAAIARNRATDRLRAADPPPCPSPTWRPSQTPAPRRRWSGGCSPTSSGGRWTA